MHELALCESVIRIIEGESAEQGFRKVRRVRLRVGALACVAPQSLDFCFQAVSRGTIAEGATLELVDVEGQGWCFACDGHVALAQRHGPCPVCGSTEIVPTDGLELSVSELEVD